jgi:hypothetical protein
MARRINRGTYDSGEKLPPFTVDQLPNGAGTSVLKVAEAYELNLRDTDTGGVRKQLKVMFCTADGEVIPFAWWPNRTSAATLIARCGDDLDVWPGRLVPLHSAETANPRTGEKVVAVWALPADEWDRALADAGGTKITGAKRKR